MRAHEILDEGWKEKLAAGALAASLVAGSGYGLYKLNNILQHEKQEFLSQITDPADRAAYEKAVNRMSLAAANANIGPAYRGIALQRQYEVAKMRDQLVKKYHIKDKD